MITFFKGLLFLLVYTNALVSVGTFVFPKQNFFKKLIAGYLIYYTGQFFLGFVVQYFVLPILIYDYIIAAVLVGLNAITLFHIYRYFSEEGTIKEKLKGLWQQFKEHIHQYWLLYIFTIVLLFLSIFYAPGHWLSNQLDDGYYITKITNYVALIPSNIDCSTGFAGSTMLERMVNTFEIDLASYCYLFKIDVLLFVNYFYTAFNYFLIIIVAQEFFESLLGKKNNYLLAIGAIGVVFFGAYPKYFEILMLAIQDSWQFQTAIWYGSSICRIPAIFIIFLGMFWFEDDLKKQIIHFILCGFVLMSKGTQALPILAIAGIINLVVVLLKSKVNIIFKVLPFAGFVGLSVILSKIIPYHDDVEEALTGIANSNFHCKLFLGICLIFVLLTIINYKNNKIIKWNLILLTFILSTYIDLLDDVVIAFSIYNFVGARMTTCILFTLVVTIGYETVYTILELAAKKVKFNLPKIGVIIDLAGCIALIITSFVYLGGVTKAVSNVKENPYLRYNTVIELSKELNELDEENGDEQLRAITPYLLYEGKYMVSVGTCLRYYAPELIVVSNEIRYSCKDDTNPVSQFDKEYSDAFTLLNGEYNDETFNKVMEIVGITDTNCIVLTNGDLVSYFEPYGFKCKDVIIDYDNVPDYYILYKAA